MNVFCMEVPSTPGGQQYCVQRAFSLSFEGPFQEKCSWSDTLTDSILGLKEIEPLSETIHHVLLEWASLSVWVDHNQK